MALVTTAGVYLQYLPSVLLEKLADLISAPDIKLIKTRVEAALASFSC